MMLNALFGISPSWFSDEYLAKTMILIVNTWLGYPYMMILCMGLLKSIPDDLYEASAIDGANPLHNLRHITIPMIIKPLAPLLIASFAFNFNNFVLINLLTGGMPSIIDASTPAGTTGPSGELYLPYCLWQLCTGLWIGLRYCRFDLPGGWFYCLGQPEGYSHRTGAISYGDGTTPKPEISRVGSPDLYDPVPEPDLFPFLMIISYHSEPATLPWVV